MKSTLKEKSKILEGLNKQQEKAVTFKNGPLLIIAGAGTGKTTVLTRRIAWLIEQGLAQPEEVLALTFTEKASKEMEERVDQLMPLGYVDINISTFHAFAQSILQQHALDVGLPGDFKILTDTQAWMLVHKNIHDFKLDYYKPIGNPNKFIHSLLRHFNKAKGEEITPEKYLEYAQSISLKLDQPELKVKKSRKKSKEKDVSILEEDDQSGEIARITELANAYHQYQKLLLDNGFMDFGDLINYALKLFRTRPKILKHYQEKFKYILVDEFQDTDLSQYELVKLLAGPQNNITVVGDDDQSIYKFRGASISNILKFKEDYPDTTDITLTDNYRSNQNILDQSYTFIQQNNPERLETKLKISKKLISHNKIEGEIKVLHSRTVYQESCNVADKITELKENNANLNFNDFAILVRANDHAEAFIAELTKRGIPYIFVANRGLYRKPFILDIIAYLRLLDNYHENENLFRIFNTRKFKISDFDLINISQMAKRKTLSIYEVLQQIPGILKVSNETADKIRDLTQSIEKHTNLARTSNASECLVKILNDLGILKNLAEDSAENAESRSLLEQFYKKSQRYEEENVDKSVKGFLNHIKMELEAGDLGELVFDPNSGPEAVRIMTVHSAKGLEFDTVFVVNMVEQRFPSRDRKEQIEIPTELVKEILSEGDVHLMEERRLFYVAMTRAKTNLYLTWSDDYGGSTNKKPSRFLVELGLEQEPDKKGPSGEVFFAEPKVLAKKIPTFTIPDTFSFSQISCFKYCPLEYKYKYIYHLPMPGEAQLSFGDTIHKTLEKFLLHVNQINSLKQPDLFGQRPTDFQIPSKDVLYKFYEECWVDDWYRDKIQKQSYQKLGRKMLDNFFERFKENPKPVKFLEKRFKLKLGSYKFVGKIDRGDLNDDGTIDIVDYKTGKTKTKLTADDKAQLLIYQWAAQEEFKEKVNSLSYWYLDHLRDFEQFVGSEEDIAKTRDNLLKTIEEIADATRNNSFVELDLKKSHECKYRNLER